MPKWNRGHTGNRPHTIKHFISDAELRKTSNWARSFQYKVQLIIHFLLFMRIDHTMDIDFIFRWSGNAMIAWHWLSGKKNDAIEHIIAAYCCCSQFFCNTNLLLICSAKLHFKTSFRSIRPELPTEWSSHDCSHSWHFPKRYLLIIVCALSILAHLSGDEQTQLCDVRSTDACFQNHGSRVISLGQIVFAKPKFHICAFDVRPKKCSSMFFLPRPDL